jgi:hypothetical protein
MILFPGVNPERGGGIPNLICKKTLKNTIKFLNMENTALLAGNNIWDLHYFHIQNWFLDTIFIEKIIRNWTDYYL